MDIVVWLRGLGLGRYEAAFRENEIDETVLPHLTAEDLKDLGVVIVGHRRKLLDAIAALRTGAPAPSADAATSGAAGVFPEDHAERRQVTVMFSDFARTDPEDLREFVAAFRKCVTDTVGRFDGFVAKYPEDGVLVYFGYPRAHEDDAERAVSAGLELIAATSRLKTYAALQTRVGIATGLVVVDDLIGADASQEQAIVGETLNLAARLQAVAEPNSVLIAESTRKLVGDLFELQYFGAQELKGISGPVRAWAAVRPSSVESRFEALHSSSLTQLVGREEELEFLLRRWSKAKSGEGQVVLLSGEAGIGKSRLTAAMLERLATEPHTRLRYFCSPQRTDSPFFPIISQMEHAAGLTREDTVQAKLDKLDTLLAQSSTSPKDAALFAEMLSLPNDGRYQTLELAPQQRRQKTLEALTAQLKALSQSNPVLMIFEDAHWADPTTLEVFGRVVDRIIALPALLLLTFRPEFKPPWIGQPQVTVLTINRLARRAVDTLIERVVGNRMLAENIRDDIIERTDGVPLFVEEMTKAVLEAGSESAVERTLAAVPSPALAVPASLHASLMARLDRLGSAKEVAQTAAVIGREFSHALLAAVTPKNEPELQLALGRLLSAGLLFRKGAPPHSTYLFNHSLVQDAAYGSLLREPRRALHARIAETLETQLGEIAENQPELLAHHCTEAGLIEKAAGLWAKAGQRSLARSALVEAIAQLSRALDQITTLRPTSELRREQVKLQVALITPLMHVKGHASAETKAATERARILIEQAESLGEPPEDPLLLFSVLYSIWVANYMAFKGDAMRELSAQFLAFAEKQKTSAALAMGHRLIAASLILTGDLMEGREHFDRTLALYNPAEHGPLASRFGQDIRVAALAYRSWTLWLLGYPQAALTDAEQGLKYARDIGQAASLMYALFHTSFSHLLCGSYAMAKAEADELVTLATEKGALFWKAHGLSMQGCLSVRTGSAKEGVELIASGIAGLRRTQATALLSWYISYLARASAELGRSDEATRSICDVMSTIETTKEKWCEAEIFRVAGEVAMLSANPEAAEAEAYFERALAVARKQQARSWELRAAMSLARLWRDQGKRQQARGLLATVYGWFREGYDTGDLKEAKALLEDLAA